jgi:hypothetical protein
MPSREQMVADAPVGTVLPFEDDDYPENWRVLDGSTYDPKEYPEFAEILKDKLEFPMIKEWWEGYGGSETTFPNLATYELKLVIKVKNG